LFNVSDAFEDYVVARLKVLKPLSADKGFFNEIPEL
jgi:hypothetical protein